MKNVFANLKLKMNKAAMDLETYSKMKDAELLKLYIHFAPMYFADKKANKSKLAAFEVIMHERNITIQDVANSMKEYRLSTPTEE